MLDVFIAILGILCTIAAFLGVMYADWESRSNHDNKW